MKWIRPFHDRILVKPDPQVDRTRGGIWLPDQAQDRAKSGVVVSVGSEVSNDKIERWDGQGPQVKLGDRVFYGWFAGTEVFLNGESHFIVKEEEVLAVLEGASHAA